MKVLKEKERGKASQKQTDRIYFFLHYLHSTKKTRGGSGSLLCCSHFIQNCFNIALKMTKEGSLLFKGIL